MQPNIPDAKILEYFRCPICGQVQIFLCPGFDQHSPAQTLIYHNNHIQCNLCLNTLSQVTCSSCNAITFLTPDIAADPFGSSYSPDVRQMERFLELNRRYMEIITQLQQIGPVDENKIVELKCFLTDYEALLESLPEKYPTINPSLVRERLADLASWIGRAFDRLLDNDQAILYFHRAASTYQQLGKEQEVKNCLQQIAQIQLRDEGIIDGEVQRLHSQIEALPENSLSRIQLLIDLGDLYMQVGDYFEARKVLHTAEKAFEYIQQLVIKDGVLQADLLADAKLPGIVNAGPHSSNLETMRDLSLWVRLLNLHTSLNSSLSSAYRESNFPLATRYFEQAKQERGGEMLTLLEVKHNFDALHYAYQQLQGMESEQAMSVLADLLEKARQVEIPSRRLQRIESITTSLLWQGKILIALQRPDEAIAILYEAYHTLKGHWQHSRGVQILAKLVEAYAQKQQWKKVSSLCEEGIDLVELYRYKVTGPYMQSAYLTSRIDLYSWGTKAAYELKDYDLMLRRAELSKCRSILRYYQGGQRQVSSQTLRKIEQQFQHVCGQIDAAGLDSLYLDELRQKRRALWDLLTIQRFQSRTGENLPAFSLQAVQDTLAVDEAIIYYYWLDKHSLLIIVIDQKRVLPILRILTDKQQTQLQNFANFVLDLTEQSPVSHLDSVQTFSFLLLPEEAAPLLEEKQRLLFSPHRLLHAVPFHALRWKDNYLIERFAVTYVPNLSSLLYTYTSVKQHNILALGIHEYAVPGYPLRPLATAEQEVEDLKQIAEATAVPITVLKGPEARIEQVRQLATTGNLSQFTHLHFATHGSNIDSDTPMESFLFLRDSQLDGLEIANWQLQTDVVVLSACCSGQRPISGRHMKELPGDELFGLQSAFFTAGAKRILSCLWPVDDAVASSITRSFHQHITNEVQPEVALQTALKEFLASADIDQDSVYYWGPFFLSAMGRHSFTITEEA
jgi:CHAT domain-containing protein